MGSETEAALTTQIASFARYVLAHAGSRALVALGLLLLGSLTEGASILLLIPVIRLADPNNDSLVLEVPDRFQDVLGPDLQVGLLPILALLVALVLLQSLFVRFRSVYMAELLYDLINQLRIDLFRSVGQAHWHFVSRLRGAELNHALTADIERVQNATFRLFLSVQNCVLLAAYIFISCLISPSMSGFAFMSGAIVMLVLQPVRRAAAAYGRLLTANRKEQYRTVSEFLNGLKVAKSLNAEPKYVSELNATLFRVRGDFSRFVRLNAYGAMLFQATSVIVLACFTYAALRWFRLPTAEIVVLVFLFIRIAPRFTALQSDIQAVLVDLPAFQATQEIKEACDREREPPHQAPAGKTFDLHDGIELRDVTFRYAKDSPAAIERVSVSIPARQITALIGPSGSGKSTMADLLLGLLPPEHGSVQVDDQALDEESRRAWRGQVAYVPQEVFLLNDTIEANLLLASPDATEPDMLEALEAAQASEFVNRLPERLKTVVGDRGTRLSGGERQRIALARALIRKPQLLILDEATSALDWKSQGLIAETISALRGRMTIVTIAHRPSMIGFADWVISMEEGKVVEQGRFEQLISRPDSRLSRMVAAEGFESQPN